MGRLSSPQIGALMLLGACAPPMTEIGAKAPEESAAFAPRAQACESCETWMTPARLVLEANDGDLVGRSVGLDLRLVEVAFHRARLLHLRDVDGGARLRVFVRDRGDPHALDVSRELDAGERERVLAAIRAVDFAAPPPTPMEWMMMVGEVSSQLEFREADRYVRRELFGLEGAAALVGLLVELARTR